MYDTMKSLLTSNGDIAMKNLLFALCTALLFLSLNACTACEHSFGEWSVTTVPTCGQDGVKTRICTLCATEETEALTERPLHDFSDKRVLADGSNLKSAATCQSRPLYYNLCSVCEAVATSDSDVFREGESIPHTWDEGETTEPTCEIGGTVLYSCLTCDKIEREIIPALGHVWGTGILEAPSCTTAGATVYTCSVCDGKMRDPIPPAHTWGAWSLREDGATELRECLLCDAEQSRAAFVGDGKTITPTFTATTTNDGTVYTVTVPGDRIKYTGIYRFVLKGSFTVGKYVTVTTSADATIVTRMKMGETDENGYARSHHETFIAAVDQNDDGVCEDVTLSISVGKNEQTITEMSLLLVGEVVAYTSTSRGAAGVEGTVGRLPVVKAGTYTVGSFYNAANRWSTTVCINDESFSDGSGNVEKGVSLLGNYVNGSVRHNGSTNTAGLQLLGTFTLEADAPIKTSFTYTGQVVTGAGKNYVPIFLMILAEELP